ncbi:MAG: hypothetical protein OYK82_10590 [Gammaproteobacteria bacterium]|nr:hypothetical protein [Gammaproteobacteria bacterium]
MIELPLQAGIGTQSPASRKNEPTMSPIAAVLDSDIGTTDTKGMFYSIDLN